MPPDATAATADDSSTDSLPSRIAAYARFFFALVCVTTSTILCFTGSTFGLVMGKRWGRRWMLRWAILWSRSILFVCRCPLEVTFQGAMPAGGFLAYANHQSVLDIPAIFIAMDKTPIAFAAKRELFKWPFLGWYLSMAGFVEVDRSNRRRAMESYAKAARQIREEGARVIVYPEGTRSVDGSVLPFKKGAFALAIEAQAPVVPIAVDGAQRAVRKHTVRLHGHKIRVVVGAPIETKGLTVDQRDELLIKTRTQILAMHKECGGPPSPAEPMIAPPGKRTGEREA